MEAPRCEANRPEFRGRLASEKVRFGEHGRFAVFACHTRFAAVMWFVADAERPDEAGRAGTIRIEHTFADAIAGIGGAA